MLAQAPISDGSGYGVDAPFPGPKVGHLKARVGVVRLGPDLDETSLTLHSITDLEADVT